MAQRCLLLAHTLENALPRLAHTTRSQCVWTEVGVKRNGQGVEDGGSDGYK